MTHPERLSDLLPATPDGREERLAALKRFFVNETLVCLAWSERLHESTLKRLRQLGESTDPPFFICLERSLDTTAKWNLKHLLGKRFVAF